MNKNIARAALVAAIVFLWGAASLAQTQPGQTAPATLTLRQAVELALENSRDLALARVRLTVAENSAGLLRSEFRPNFFTGSGAAFTRGMPQSPGGQAPSVFELSYIQTLFNGPLRGQLRAAEERAHIEQLAYQRARDDVRAEAALAYLELAHTRHALTLLRSERASATRILQATRARAGEGLELPVEVTRAELTAARIEQAVIGLEGREEALELRLRELTGLPPDRPLEVAAEELPLGPAEPVGQLVVQALENNVELRQAEHERRAREHRLRGERNGRWPTFDLVGQYSILSRINNFDDFFNRFERHNVNLGVRIRIPIFSARTGAAVELAESELTAADLELRTKRTSIERQVRSQARRLREMEAAREVARLERKLAQEDLRVLEAQFDEGRASLRDVERARLEEHNRWRAFLDADLALQQAHLELLKTTGQLSRVLP